MPYSITGGNVDVSQQQPPSNAKIITFVVTLSLVCATVLAILASALREPQEIARELDRSRQLMMSARILNYAGYFQIKKGDEYIPAKVEEGGRLVAAEDPELPSRDQVFEVYQTRIQPMLASREGELLTFEEAGINQREYIEDNRKRGYYHLPLMLVYKVLPNPSPDNNQDERPDGFVIPINGYGLWDAIYGFLAIEPNGDKVIGISWYEQKETPGLGAVITEPQWQNQFHCKEIFLPPPEGEKDLETAPLGLNVVKGEVENVYGDRPRAKTSVDGIPGATLTGNGVTNAYHHSLAPYRAFLIKINEKYGENEEDGNGS
jgi:Na+-transporting NADH:ubiquinone oxidoreductase subunit C